MTPDGTCIRDYIHIPDLSQAHILALTRRRVNLQPRDRRRHERP
jgi:UDP-glucose 4-epimerase